MAATAPAPARARQPSAPIAFVHRVALANLIERAMVLRRARAAVVKVQEQAELCAVSANTRA